MCRFQWPRALRRRSAAARLLRLWVRIPPGVWMSVSCDCCVLSGRGLCDRLITRPQESYRLWCLVNDKALAHWGLSLQKQNLPLCNFLYMTIICVARHHPHHTHDLHSGPQEHHPSKNSVQKTICCNSTSNAPDDGRMYPKHVELRIHQ